MLILSIIVPVLLGLGILLVKEIKNRYFLLTVTGVSLAVTAALGLSVVFGGEAELFLFSFGKNLDFYLRVDTLGRLFALVVDVGVLYKIFMEWQSGFLDTYVLYLTPHSMVIFGACAVTLTVVFSLIFAYKSTQVEIVQYLKAE